MNSFSHFLTIASDQIGLRLSFDREIGPKYLAKIRFSDLQDTQSFCLGISRNWASTEVELVPDGFGAAYLEFLAEAALSHRAQLHQLIKNNSETFSEISVHVDGRDLFEAKFDNSQKPKKFTFTSYILSSESFLKDHLIDAREQDLLLFSLKMLAVLLPKGFRPASFAEEVLGYPEGASVQVLVNKYERDPRNRKLAISTHGFVCRACGFDFKSVYGELGTDFVIIHHVTPVSEIGPDYVLNVKDDLIPVCANCHAMIHQEDPPLSLQALRKILKSQPS